MNGSVLIGSVASFRPVYGEGWLFLLGFVLGIALGGPAWLAAVAGHAVITQVPQEAPHVIGVIAHL